jgi:CMP-N-acetylneuraminic acid synthetase
MADIIAVVPVRTGSTRVVNKSMRPFCDTTLLINKLSSLKKVSNIDEIVVSSDGPEVLATARSMGVSTHKREEYFASSECTGSEFFENLAKSVDSKVIVYSPPTSPFIKPETIEEAVEIYKSLTKHDSLATVYPVKHHMWLDNQPLNYDLQHSPNSQDLPEIFRITYGICINSNKNMIKYRNVVGKDPYFLEIGQRESVDIDDMIDFEFAEFLYERET